MSLAGSLEDLGLGEFLQIASLSKRSGVLTLRSGEGEGRILVRSGGVRCAWVKGSAQTLREILLARGAVSAADYDACRSIAQNEGRPLREVLVARTTLDAERLEELLRANLEAAVATMFRWTSGEFRFELCDDVSPELADLFVSADVSAQFLAMEGTRVLDEASLGDAVASDTDTGARAVEVLAGAALARADPAPDSGSIGVEVSEAPSTAARIPISVPETTVAAGGGRTRGAPPVIVVDCQLHALEWMKRVLEPRFPRVHIFQRAELATARVRQYLARAEVPLILLSANASDDRTTGATGVSQIAARLKAHSALLEIVLLTRDGRLPQLPRDASNAISGCVRRPAAREFGDAGAAASFGDAVCAAFEEGRG